MRATINERKGIINFLTVFETNQMLRSAFKRINFTVANSFKTKCLLEQLDQENFLVLIDLFDRKEYFIQENLFEVQEIILLSNVFEIDVSYKAPFKKFAEQSSCDSLIYFILRKKKEFSEVLRKNKEVFFYNKNIYSEPLKNMYRLRESSKIDPPKLISKQKKQESSNSSTKKSPLNKDLLLGFLEQENRAVRKEIRDSSRPDLFQDYKCSEFIDFCLLWSQKIKIPESSLFGNRKNQPKFKIINGQHSIINTAMNSVAFRIKHNIEQKLIKKFHQPLNHRRNFDFDSNMRDPLYKVSLQYPREVEHDFEQSPTCTVDVSIRVTCLFKGADTFSKVHLDKDDVKENDKKILLSDDSDIKASSSKSAKWFKRLENSKEKEAYNRPKYIKRFKNRNNENIDSSKKPKKPQLILKLSNIHHIEDSESSSSRSSSSRSGKRKDSSNSKLFPVMIWQGNRNISIQVLEDCLLYTSPSPRD